MEIETWYVLDDGNAGDPAEIAAGKDGKLAHRDGRKVAYAPHGPRTRSVDADAERKKTAVSKAKLVLDPDGNPPSDAAPTATRDLTADKPKGGYKTRESKAG